MEHSSLTGREIIQQMITNFIVQCYSIGVEQSLIRARNNSPNHHYCGLPLWYWSKTQFFIGARNNWSGHTFLWSNVIVVKQNTILYLGEKWFIRASLLSLLIGAEENSPGRWIIPFMVHPYHYQGEKSVIQSLLWIPVVIMRANSKSCNCFHDPPLSLSLRKLSHPVIFVIRPYHYQGEKEITHSPLLMHPFIIRAKNSYPLTICNASLPLLGQKQLPTHLFWCILIRAICFLITLSPFLMHPYHY